MELPTKTKFAFFPIKLDNGKWLWFNQYEKSTQEIISMIYTPEIGYTQYITHKTLIKYKKTK